MRSKALTVALFAGIFAISGCSSAPEPTPTQTVTPTQTQSAEPEPEPVFVAAPLTGVLYEEGSNPLLELPAVSAKIDNTTAGRPQLALNDADVVYVTRVEVGLTRLLPIWHSRMPQDIGPIRSVRPVDALIIDAYDGVFVYSGGQAPFKNAVKATGLVMSDEDTEMGNNTYFRESSRVAPWNLLFRAADLQQRYAEQQPAPKPGFEFDAIPSAVAQGTAVLGLSVKYPDMRSEWQLGTATYPWSQGAEPSWLRTQDRREHVQQDGARVVAKNVVVLEVVHDLSFVDPKYGAIPKAKIVDNAGIAHIFSDGYYLQGTWAKGAQDSHILLFDEAGNPVKLAIGNTWVEMMDLPRSSLDVVLPEVEASE